MGPFRSRLVCRVLVLALAGALGLTAAAPASARGPRAETLRAVLGDAEAVEAALDAVRDVPAAGRLAAFADAYARTADDGTTAEAVERLLGADSMSGVAPVVTQRAVAGPSATPAPALGVAADSRGHALVPPTTSTARADRQRMAPPRPEAPPSRPRAP